MTSPTPSSDQLFKKILVVHLGPVGNWILATGAFQDLRETFPHSRIVLFTRHSLSRLAARTGWFDEIVSTAWTNWREYLRHPASLAQEIFFKTYWTSRLRKHDFGLVVDLQGTRALFEMASGLGKIALPLRDEPGAHLVEWYRRSIEAIGVPAHHEPYLPPATTTFARRRPLWTDANGDVAPARTTGHRRRTAEHARGRRG